MVFCSPNQVVKHKWWSCLATSRHILSRKGIGTLSNIQFHFFVIEVDIASWYYSSLQTIWFHTYWWSVPQCWLLHLLWPHICTPDKSGLKPIWFPQQSRRVLRIAVVPIFTLLPLGKSDSRQEHVWVSVVTAVDAASPCSIVQRQASAISTTKHSTSHTSIIYLKERCHEWFLPCSANFLSPELSKPPTRRQWLTLAAL